MKGSIVLGKHNMQFQMNQIDTMYKDDWSGRFDGVHLYNRQGKIAYTSSVGQIIKANISFHEQDIHSYHKTCPQTQYKLQNINKKQYYNIPVRNQFEVLGN